MQRRVSTIFGPFQSADSDHADSPDCRVPIGIDRVPSVSRFLTPCRSPLIDSRIFPRASDRDSTRFARYRDAIKTLLSVQGRSRVEILEISIGTCPEEDDTVSEVDNRRV